MWYSNPVPTLWGVTFLEKHKCKVLWCLWPLFKIYEGPAKFPVPSLRESVGKIASHINYYKTYDKRATIMVILNIN